MSDAVLQTILQVLGGGIIGFLIARYAANQQKTKKYIAYKTGMIPLLRLHEDTPDSIKVTVDKSVITGNEQDSGSQVPVKSAVAHSIVLKNKGNSTASDVNIDIIFDEEVNILSYSSTPAPSNYYKMTLDRVAGDQNILRVFIPPYLNPEHEIILSLVATVDESPSNLKIVGTGKGVEVAAFNKSASPFPVALIFLVTLFIVFALFEGAIVQNSLGSMFPDKWVHILGGTVGTVEVRVLSFSMFHKIFAIVSAVLILGAAIYRQRVKNRFYTVLI